ALADVGQRVRAQRIVPRPVGRIDLGAVFVATRVIRLPGMPVRVAPRFAAGPLKVPLGLLVVVADPRIRSHEGGDEFLLFFGCDRDQIAPPLLTVCLRVEPALRGRDGSIAMLRTRFQMLVGAVTNDGAATSACATRAKAADPRENALGLLG